jgi:hypothetical protein
MNQLRRRWGRLLSGSSALLAIAAADTIVHGQNYRLERIASGLNQPTYVTQAPGDPANVLYFTERTSNTIGGFSAVNQMGKVWRYDVETRTKTLVLDLSSRQVTNDDGLQTIAFSPDFNTVGAPTYHKMYASSAQYPNPGNALNRVEEYAMNPDGTFGSGRVILQYSNNTQNNHTVNWIGFDPNATGVSKNYLYISTGDGSFGNNYNGGLSPNGRPSQNPSDVRGKILRVDVSGPDSYPTSSTKNFAIPASNPLPTYNAAHPGSPIAGLGEAYVTGVRNGYRVSFDRATSDLYWGDVGESSVEEIDFLRAGSNNAGPPIDFGWPQKEGLSNSTVGGAPTTGVNPFTGVAATNPIQTYAHAIGRAAIGGYVYRGPITELQGRYLYADFVSSRMWTLAFDRNTDPATFSGNNGTNADATALWQSLVYDPTDPSYAPSTSQLDLLGIDHIVSFGEDNVGNLYIVDFGNRSPSQGNFDGQYPNAGLGEIFKLTPTTLITLTVNRETGSLALSNPTGAAANIRGYAVLSAAGSLNPVGITPIAGHYDKAPGGDGSFDPNNSWQVTSPVGSRTSFSEASAGTAAAWADNQTVSLSPSGGWIKSPFEDLRLSITLDSGVIVPGAVSYIGNGGQAFARSDLNTDGAVDGNDWLVFLANNLTNLSGLMDVDQHNRGDLNGDNANDFHDFRVFQADFDAANGAGAFAAAFGDARVPEPAGWLLALGGHAAVMMPALRRHSRFRK